MRNWIGIAKGLGPERRGGRQPWLQEDGESKEDFVKLDKKQSCLNVDGKEA